jgi:hypothetical protein
VGFNTSITTIAFYVVFFFFLWESESPKGKYFVRAVLKDKHFIGFNIVFLICMMSELYYYDSLRVSALTGVAVLIASAIRNYSKFLLPRK